MKLTIDIWGQTDTGKIREHNEDSFVVAEDLSSQTWGGQQNVQIPLGKLGALLVVADGMGGTNAGEVASQIAVEEVKEIFSLLREMPEDVHAYLKEAIMQAHQAILAHAKAHPKTRGMGTTLIIAWVYQGLLYVAWSGDSRCYLYREGIEVRPISEDHSLVWEMVKNEVLTPEQARIHPDSNIITQSLGNHREAPQPDTLRQAIPLQSNDRLLICSDGLNSMISDADIGTILSQKQSPKLTCQSLIQAANDAGGYDNTTTILLDVVEVIEEVVKGAIQEVPEPAVIAEVAGSTEGMSQFEQTVSIDPILAVEASESEESVSSSNSWLWIIGGILLFGGLTFAGIFWVGQRSTETSLAPPLLQESNPSIAFIEDSMQLTDEHELMAANENPPVSTRGVVLRSATETQEPSSDNANNDNEVASIEESTNEVTESAQKVNGRLSQAPVPNIVQQKVSQILNLKYDLIRYDRLEILDYKPLSQEEKNNLRYIKSRVLNQQPNSIYHDVTKLVRLGGGKEGEVIDIKIQDNQTLMGKLDKLLSELNRFERLIRQMEQ